MQKEVNLKIEGMTCGHCKNFVSELIDGVDGVVSQEVSLENVEAKVVFDSEKTSEAEITKAINNSQTYQVK